MYNYNRIFKIWGKNCIFIYINRILYKFIIWFVNKGFWEKNVNKRNFFLV